MGVPAFYKWLKTRYPKCILNALSKDDLEYLYEEFQAKNGDENEIDLQEGDLDYEIESRIKENNPELDNLYLDMNGIIHPCCHPQGKPQPKNEVEMFNNIFEYTDKVISIVKPKKLIYFAIDGVAPRAKMNQQRSRRFRTAQDIQDKKDREAELRSKWEQKGVKFSDKANQADSGNIFVQSLIEWDSNVITPGTEFMDRLSKALEYYIMERSQTHNEWKGVKIIYSDASVPGEGEHKILDFIRSQRLQQGYDANTKHCIYGADADLIMLGLSTHEPHFFILREKVQDPNEMRCNKCGKTGHQEIHCDSNLAHKIQLSRSVEFQFIKIAVVREYLYLEFKDLERILPFKFDFERIVDDFVFMCFFVGNDFLPHLPSLAIRDGSIDMIMVIYKHLLPSLGDYLTNNGQLDFSRVDVLFRDIAKVEEPVFKQRRQYQERRREQNRNGNNYNRDNNRSYSQQREQRSQNNNSQSEQSKVEEKKNQEKEKEDEEKKMSLEELEKREVEELQDLLKSDQLGEDEKNKVAAEKMKKVIKKMFDEENDKVTSAYVDNVQLGVEGWKERQKIRQSYIEGLQWVFSYYYKGCVSWYWFYPYHYSPFASDLVNSDRVKIQQDAFLQFSRFELGEPATPFEQLLAVFPRQSAHAIPKCFQHLLLDPNSEILDFYPTSFEFDLNGAPYTWMGVNLLPFIDRERLVQAMRKYEDQLTPKEKERNSFKSTFLFFEILKDSKSTMNQFFQKQDFKSEKLTLGASFKRLDGVEGTIKGYSGAKSLNQEMNPPFSDMSLSKIKSNQVVQVQYEHSKYEKHLIKLLQNVQLPRREVEDFEIHNVDRRLFQGNRAIEMAGREIGIDVSSYVVYRGSGINYTGYQNNHARGVQGVTQEGDRYGDRQLKRRREEVEGNNSYQDQYQAKRFKSNTYQGGMNQYQGQDYYQQQQHNYYQNQQQQNVPNYNLHQYKQYQNYQNPLQGYQQYNQVQQQPEQPNAQYLFNLLQSQQQQNAPRQQHQQNPQHNNSNRFQAFQDLDNQEKEQKQSSRVQQQMDEDNQIFHQLLQKGNTPNKDKQQ